MQNSLSGKRHRVRIVSLRYQYYIECHVNARYFVSCVSEIELSWWKKRNEIASVCHSVKVG